MIQFAKQRREPVAKHVFMDLSGGSAQFFSYGLVLRMSSVTGRAW